MKSLIDKLEKDSILTKDEFTSLIQNHSDDDELYAAKKARKIADDIYGKEIYIRGLIEFTNYCRNDCYYCGIQRSNKYAERYRLSKEQILCAANKAMSLATARSCFKAAKTRFIQTKQSKTL